MRVRHLPLLLLVLIAARADDLKPVFPGADWECVPSPEAAGFSRAKLEGYEAWSVKWQVHAMAARVNGQLGRKREGQDARARYLHAAERVATTLVDEPALQESLRRRVNSELALSAKA